MQKKIVLSSLIVIIIISFSIYFFIERDFEKVKEVKNVEDSYDIEVEYDIEDIIYSDIDIVIKGWLVQIGSNNKYINRSILLKGDDGTIISIKTEAENRRDLAEKNTSETIYNKQRQPAAAYYAVTLHYTVSRRMRMVHQYKNNGRNIVLDVNSGSVHVVDDLAYDAIALYDKKSEEEIVQELKGSYPENDIREVL